MGPERRRSSLHDASLVEMQVHGEVLVGVANGEALPSDLETHPQLFPRLAEEGLRIGLARLHLAAGKLPEQRPALPRQALLHQVAAGGGLDQRRHHPDLAIHSAPGWVTCRP